MSFLTRSARRRRIVTIVASAAAAASSLSLLAGSGIASGAGALTSGNLLVSTSVWSQDAPITAGTTSLPPNCGTLADDPCVTAVAPGTYPLVFNNVGPDPSFGVTQPIVLDELNPTDDTQIASLTVPNSTQNGITASSDQMVTSFSSKSEIALNQSTDGQDVTFMGYVAPVGAVDVSNSNTPGAVDPTNSAGTTPYYRAVAQLDGNSNFQFTETNAYSGNNGRAAILDPTTNSIYSVGNAGNGANPEPQGVVTGAGSDILAPSTVSESNQNAGAPAPLANFNVTQLGDSADKSAKDNNYRGLTLSNNVIYFTKGSGSNGVDTVYYLDTTGSTCPAGSGVPSSSATLPNASTFTPPAYSTSNAALGLKTSNPGLTPTNTCILKGFPTAIAKNATDSSDYPFGIWFANPTTLYVADEGAGDSTYSATTSSFTAAAASTTAGLQKWTLNTTTNTWSLDYTLQSGLNLGVPYSVANSGGNAYPTGLNSTDGGTGLPWTPATDGLRNLIGQVNSNGTVNIWATTSTVSGAGDQGADPNKLVSITDNLASTSLPNDENFSTVMPATYGQVIRGVSFTPQTAPPVATPEVPVALLLPVAGVALGGGSAVFIERKRRRRPGTVEAA
jgi:hypothetical protein